jgi:TatD DNase family protein
MQLFDAHCHVQDERLAPHREAVLARARDAGIARLMCCGSAEDDWGAVQALAERYPAIGASYGLHPGYMRDRTPGWLDGLGRRLSDSRAAVGEIGLDHMLDPATFAEQEEVFVAQLRLARDLGRPASIHCRRAWGRMMDVLQRTELPDGLLFHAFSGSRELVAALLPLGARFSFSGTITRSHNRRGREALTAVPLDRLLIETDAPDLAPVLPADAAPVCDDRGVVNEPAHLVHVLRSVAAIQGVSEEDTALRTWENAAGLFGLGSRTG